MKNAIAELQTSLDSPDARRLFAGMEKMVWERAT
jgi:hypothetical protein